MSDGSGVLNTVFHGIIRPNPIEGQVYAKGSASAPILVGKNGGIVVEGISPSAGTGAVVVNDTNVPNVNIQILAANPNRRSNIFQNNGAVDVYLGFDAPAVAGQGITLIPNVAWESTVVFQGNVFAVTAAGVARVTVLST